MRTLFWLKINPMLNRFNTI